MSRRAGHLIIGVDSVRQAMQADQVRVVVLARDASARARERIVRLARGKEVPLLAGPDAQIMARGLGLSEVMAVAVADRSLADGLLSSGAATPWTED
ncbi:MAG: ribosomal L7Ae/L30e/S12e/Gadd45 family protein [Gemmatimonadota bacterium]